MPSIDIVTQALQSERYNCFDNFRLREFRVFQLQFSAVISDRLTCALAEQRS
jgi:hypothetical protein